MRIDHVSQPFKAEIAKQVDSVQKKVRPNKVKEGDKAEFSSDGKLLNDTLSSLQSTRSYVEKAPEVRVNRVAEVKEKIKQGYYDSPEFADQLAEKLIKDAGKELGLT